MHAVRYAVNPCDGVRIPVTLVWHRSQAEILAKQGLSRIARPPCLVYGYGAYGECLDTSATVDRLVLLLRGWTLAFAHVRGGGELGRPWYHAGRGVHKAQSFLDFVACADFLCASGVATPAHLAAWGHSAGGLLVATSVLKRPGLFRAAVLEYAFVDVLTQMLDAAGPLTVPEYDEWGDPQRDLEAYCLIRAYSPYELLGRLKRGEDGRALVDRLRACPNESARRWLGAGSERREGDGAWLHPHVLLTSSRSDARVPSWQQARYAARLLSVVDHARGSAGGEPAMVFLRTDDGAAHYGFTDPDASLDARGGELAFLHEALGVCA